MIRKTVVAMCIFIPFSILLACSSTADQASMPTPRDKVYATIIEKNTTTTSTATETSDQILMDSSDDEGNEENFGSDKPSISSDGQFVTFESKATNLVSGDTNGHVDIFVRDHQSGVVERISVSSSGEQGISESSNPSISANGRYVAFDSWASNLVGGDTNGFADTFVRDRQSSVTTLVSVSSSGEQGNHNSSNPSISSEGRFVAFVSNGSNLVGEDTNGESDIFVHDRQTGMIEMISISSSGVQGNDWSRNPFISSDGRFIVYTSKASNLVSGDTNNQEDIFVFDRQRRETERVSVSSSGDQGNHWSRYDSISDDGRFVAFESTASNLVSGDTKGFNDIFVRDRQKKVTERVSLSSSGEQGNYVSNNPIISANGRFVIFTSNASNLVSGDTNGYKDIFVHDRQSGITEIVSISSTGEQGDRYSGNPVISTDGRYVAFESFASNLVSGDPNIWNEIFIRDRCPDGSCGGIIE
jgi:hypothetical protein